MDAPLKTGAGRREAWRDRLVTAGAALGLGALLCFAMFSLLTPYGAPTPRQAEVWLLTAIPFAGLAVLIVSALRRSAALGGWIALAALTALSYALAFHPSAWWDNSPNVPLLFGVLYGLIVLGHLAPLREHRSPAAAASPVTPNATTARRLWILLFAWTVLTVAPCFWPWTSNTGSTFAFCMAVVVPLWGSAAFVLVRLARDRASKLAAWLWVLATCWGLLLLSLGVLVSQIPPITGD